jgi:hypothetical protein
MSSSELEELETHDIYLAAYLSVAGCELKRRYRVGPRVYFVFTNSAGSINDLRQSYYAGTAVVKAHDYSQKIIGMKNLCFEGK